MKAVSAGSVPGGMREGERDSVPDPDSPVRRAYERLVGGDGLSVPADVAANVLAGGIDGGPRVSREQLVAALAADVRATSSAATLEQREHAFHAAKQLRIDQAGVGSETALLLASISWDDVRARIRHGS